MQKLLDIMKQLRDPENGCPWDKEQDFASIAPYTIEEAYEVSEAINNSDMDELKDELGDLLLQVVFHSQMAKELGHFSFEDVVEAVCTKMLRRHPHVFGDETADQSLEVNEIWEQQKDKEKQDLESVLDGVALALPALMRAQKLQKRAARAQFEWKDSDGAFAKFEEELAELSEALNENNLEHIQEEYGDALFCFVNYGRMLGLDTEAILRQTNAKFERRFKAMEAILKDRHKDMKNASLDEMLEAWGQVKTELQQNTGLKDLK